MTIETVLDGLLAEDDATRARLYPGPPPGRQPVHTCYVAADRLEPDTAEQWGTQALLTATEGRVRAKLAAEPVEDLRADLEDGYGLRADDVEDADARRVGRALTATTAPFCGVRIKSLEAPTRRRAIRSLQIVLDELGSLPPGFRVTLPKVTSVAQVVAMVALCEHLSDQLRFEIQVETPQAVLGADGTALIAPMIHAAQGRCAGIVYGTYDYSASLGIAAAQQSMEHPAADHAKAVMQVAAAQTGVPLSDGSTNILPIGPGAAQASALHARLVRRSLERGFYQGWDLHPAQLPTRYAATFAFFQDGRDAAVGRLNAYLTRQGGDVLDEPATAVALAGYLLRGLEAGAYDDAGLPADQLAAIARPPRRPA